MKFLLIFVFVFSTIMAKDKVVDDETLRLMCDSFLYSKDLKHAYKIAKKGVKLYPNSLYWHKKLADVALWDGKTLEAIDQMIYLYRHNNDSKTAKKIIKEMIASYQYQKALPVIKEEYEKKNIDKERLIDIYDKVGKPEEVIELLKKRYEKVHNSSILSSILALELKVGDLKGANKSVRLLLKNGYDKTDTKTALALSKYFFLKKDIDKSYKFLLDAKKSSNIHDIEYFQRLSDFADYMHDDSSSLYASFILYRNSKARAVDLDRLQRGAKDLDDKTMQNISKDALLKYKNKKIFINYLSSLLDKKKFEILDSSIKSVLNNEKLYKKVLKDAKFWLIKSKSDQHFSRMDIAKQDINKALQNIKQANQIRLDFIWFLIDNNYYDALDKVVSILEKDNNLNQKFYHPLAAANLILQRGDKAFYFCNLAKKIEPKDMSIDFLKVEILQFLGREKDRREVLKNILRELKHNQQKNPKLANDAQFLRRYIEASMEFKSPKVISKMIDKAKGKLSKKDFNELKMMLALKEKNIKDAQSVYKSYKEKKPLTLLDIAILKHDKHMQKELLKDIPKVYPFFSKMDLAVNENKIQRAIKIGEKAQQQNKKNILLDRYIASLQKDYATKFLFQSGYHYFENLKISSFIFNNDYYLKDGYILLTNFEFYDYKSRRKEFINLHEDYQKREFIFHVGINKHIKDGKLGLMASYRDFQKSEIGYSFELLKNLNSNLSFNIKWIKNARIDDESDVLVIGGKKDDISFWVDYALNSSISFIASGKKRVYFSQDDLKLADAKLFDFTTSYDFIPEENFGIKAMYRLGRFNKKRRASPLIYYFLTPKSYRWDLISDDYDDVGFGLYYQDSYLGYGKSFHPYFDFSIFYGLKNSDFSSQSLAGFSGSFNKNDRYNLEALYQNSVNGYKYENFGLTFSYSHLY